MVNWGRLNMFITATAVVWSLVVYLMYSNSLSSCFDESMRLRMAVERKDRFLELLRDQNDNLKAEILKLHETMKIGSEDVKVHKRMFMLKEMPRDSNRTRS